MGFCQLPYLSRITQHDIYSKRKSRTEDEQGSNNQLGTYLFILDSA